MSLGESFLFGESDERPPLRFDSVVRRWWVMLAEEAPWSTMRPDDALGMMSRILRELLSESREVERRAQDVRVAAAAHEHGAFRRSQACRLEDLTSEFDALFAALVDELRANGFGGLTLGNAMVSLRAELGLAQKAAITGWSLEPLKGGADANRSG